MTQFVDFAYRPDHLPEGGNLSGRPVIFEMLHDRDLTPVISLNAETAFVDADTMTAWSLELANGTEMAHQIGTIATEQIAVLINRVGRSLKPERLPDGLVLPPMVNENRTRSLAYYKATADARLFGPLLGADPMRIPTLLLGDRDHHEFMGAYPADKYIIKPNSGTNSEGVRVVPNAEAVAYVPHDDKPMILQPAYDFTVPLPRAIRPYDCASAELFEGWSRATVPKELRVYGFRSPAGVAVFPVARAIQNGDQWFFLDPESVPERVLGVTRDGIEQAAQMTGATALMGTFDFGYGPLTGGHYADWRLIEFNGRAPYLIGADKHAGVALQLRHRLVDMVHHTALSVPVVA